VLPRQLRLDVRAADLYHYIAAGEPEVARYQRIDATVHDATTFRLLQAELRNGKGGKNPADLQPFSRSLYAEQEQPTQNWSSQNGKLCEVQHTHSHVGRADWQRNSKSSL
jgi:hypothetical protein